MQIAIRTRALDLGPRERAGIERRLRLALGTHAGRIADARVTLVGAEAPPEAGRRGRERPARCRVAARFLDESRLVVDERGADLEAALAAAFWRLDHRLRRPVPGRARTDGSPPRDGL